MIKTIFPVNVFVKDYKFSEEFADEVASAAQAIYTKYRVETNKDNIEIGDNEIPFFTKENITAFPVLEELKEVFREGFSELNKSYEENIITDDMINRMMERNEGKLPFLKKGEYKQVHTHS